MPRSTKDPSLQVPMILWAAMLVSHGVILLVGRIVPGQEAGAVSELQTLSIALTGAGVMTALASALAVPLIARTQMFISMLLLRFALAESATIFGLVLATLGADAKWVYALTGLGVLAHVAAFPTEREREVHEQRRKAAGS